MFPTKVRIEIAMLLVAGVCEVVGWTASADETAATSDDLSTVDQCVEQWQLTAEETRFDQIGWAHDLPLAWQLARTHDRPLFVFTYSGSATEANAIALRRC